MVEKTLTYLVSEKRRRKKCACTTFPLNPPFIISYILGLPLALIATFSTSSLFLFKVARTYNTNTAVRARTSKSSKWTQRRFENNENRLPFPKFDHRKNETCSQRSVRSIEHGTENLLSRRMPRETGTHDQTHKEDEI